MYTRHEDTSKKLRKSIVIADHFVFSRCEASGNGHTEYPDLVLSQSIDYTSKLVRNI